MSNIIHIKDAIAKRNKNQDLTEMLKRATILKQQLPDYRNKIQVTSFQKLKEFFEAKISNILIKWKFIDSDFFFCGNYISGLLTSIGHKAPESWFVIDYILESQDNGSPQIIKQGANVCFLICTVFKERSEWRTMRYEDYESMGIGLFHQYYDQTGVEIGYYMSRQYKTMVRVTDECMKTI